MVKQEAPFDNMKTILLMVFDDGDKVKPFENG